MYLLLLAFLLAISTLLVGQTGPQLTANVVVDSVGITNDSLVSSEHLQQLRQEITKQQFGETAEIAQRARYELQKEGYFKADVTTSDSLVLSETPGQRIIAVTLRITEGQQYRLAGINFAHNSVFTSSQLRLAFPNGSASRVCPSNLYSFPAGLPRTLFGLFSRRGFGFRRHPWKAHCGVPIAGGSWRRSRSMNLGRRLPGRVSLPVAVPPVTLSDLANQSAFGFRVTTVAISNAPSTRAASEED